MPHFYVKPEHIKNNSFIIDGDEYHHIARVLRKNNGDIVRLFDGEGHTYQGRIDTITSEHIQGTIIEAPKRESSPSVFIHIYQALPKGTKFDFIVEKCTELGMASITPLMTERCIKKISDDKKPHALARWRKIAHSASKQCGYATIPAVNPLKTYASAVDDAARDTMHILPWEGEEQRTLKEALKNFDRKKIKNIALWIGSEGGFTRKEIAHAQENGFITVTLGERILRAETAGLVALSILQYELGML